MSDPLSNYQLVIPPEHLQDALRGRLSERGFQRVQTIFLLKSTAQAVENTVSEWFAGTVGSPARFQTLAILWAARGRPTPHQEIISTLRVKRATVSALMFSLEQDGLVHSVPDRQDRRRLLATLTSKGEKVISEAMDLNEVGLEEVMHDLSHEELDVLQRLLRRMRENFVRKGSDMKRADSAL